MDLKNGLMDLKNALMGLNVELVRQLNQIQKALAKQLGMELDDEPLT